MRAEAKVPSVSTFGSRESLSRGGALRSSIAALIVAASACALLLLAAPAHAAYSAAGSFGSAGSGDGQFDAPHRVAVKLSTDQVFVVDRGNDRVQVFQDDGSGAPASESVDFVTAFGSGELSDPVGIAIDQTSGAIYVTDAGDGEIVKFDSDLDVVDTFGSVGAGGGDGEFVSLAVGIAVDSTTGNVLVPDPGGRVQRLDSDGNFISDFDGSQDNPDGAFAGVTDPGSTDPAPRDIAVDSTGNIWVLQNGSSGSPRRAYKFTSAGAYLASLNPADLFSGQFFSATDVVAVDPVNADLYSTESAMFSEGHLIRRSDSSGVYQEHFGSTGPFVNNLRAGIGVNPDLGRVYISQSAADDVLAFGLPTAPDATTGDATQVTATSARLHGTIDANGSETTYQWQYGTTAAYGSVAPATPEGAGSGDGPVSRNVDISGLIPGTEYHFRLVATNAQGTTEGEDLTFTTLADPPTATTDPASAIAQTTATLNAKVNANGADADCEFQWGTTTGYGSIAPCSVDPVTGSVDTAVSAGLTGLAPNTTYHFRVVADNSGGGVNGADRSFTTLPGPPTATTGAATGVAQTGATLNATVNAKGASTKCSFEYGATSAYGKSTPCSKDPVTGEANTAVSAALTGLTAATTYHYRVVAESPGGKATGSDATFTTSAHTCATDPAPCPLPHPDLPLVSPAPVPAPGPKPKKKLKCKKGFKKVKVKGKARCKKVKRGARR